MSTPSGEQQPRKSKRAAVMVFLLGFLFVPALGVAVGELAPPWSQIASIALLVYIALMVAAAVRVAVRF